MDKPAILYLLWPKNAAALDAFLARRPVTIISSRVCIDPSVLAVTQKYGADIVLLENLLSDEEALSASADAESRFADIREKTSSLQPSTVGLASASASGFGAMTQALQATLRDQMPYLLQAIKALENARGRYAIELLVLNEDFMAQARVAAAWARNHGIPTLHLCHGANLADLYSVHGHVNTDLIAVFGERGLEPYLDLGIARERLRIVGNPAWDGYTDLVKRRKHIRTELCSRLGISPKRPLLVYATTWTAGLTLIEDTAIPAQLLRGVFRAFAQLNASARELPFLVIKDRPGPEYVQAGRELIVRLAAEVGIGKDAFSYQLEGGESWVVAADVMIACDSNILVEAMLADVPAVNLLNYNGLRLGPTFDADSGIVEVAPEELAASLRLLLDDTGFRESLLRQARAKVSYYNVGVDGSSAQRVAELMMEMAKPAARQGPTQTAAARRYVWQALESNSSAVERVDAAYHQHVRHELIALIQHPPRRVLDIGCAAGVTGEAIKRQYPSSWVYGIELSPSTAALARTRLDGVIEGSIEHLDLLECGIALGSIDTVILADVLEHTYNPWGVLTRLKPYLTADAQIIASIPNSRHISLLSDLAHGLWTYREEGLLDITHIRFFTLTEIQRLFEETGYAIERVDSMRSLEFPKLTPGGSLSVGKLVLKDLNEQDIFELQAFQLLVRARPTDSRTNLSVAPPVKIAVVLHLIYEDLWPEFRKAISQIDQPFTLFVTCPEEKYSDIRALVSIEFPDAKITPRENRGRDIMPFLSLLPNLISQGFEIICKIHSKMSGHVEQLNAPGVKQECSELGIDPSIFLERDKWRQEELNCLLGNPGLVNDIIATLNASGGHGFVVGEAFDCPLAFRMAKNIDLVSKLASRLGIPLYDFTNQRFPAGSMFWARTDALKPLLDLNLQSSDFPEEKGQFDGTAAHAVERLFYLAATLTPNSNVLLSDGGKLFEREREGRAVERSPYQLWLTRYENAALNGASADNDVDSCRFMLFGDEIPPALLINTLDSLATFFVPDWSLSIFSTSPAPDAMFDDLENLEWIKVDDLAEIHAAITARASCADETWLIIAPCGVALEMRLPWMLTQYGRLNEHSHLYYTDSDVTFPGRSVAEGFLRPDFNLDLLRSCDYLGELLAIRRTSFQEVGGLAVSNAAMLYDLALRVLDRFGETALGHIDDVLYHVPEGCLRVPEAGVHRQALLQHLERNQIRSFISDGAIPGTWRVTYLPEGHPKVSILIPTKDQVDLLRACVDSILAMTKYPDYEIIIVDNQSTQAETRKYLESLKDHVGKVRVLTYAKPFNFSAICNLAAREASGEYLLLLNNDTEVLQEAWLDLMMYHAQRPEIGIVGAKLLFPGSKQIQHAGVLLGLGGIAEHPFLGLLGPNDPGYMARAVVDQDLSAVTAACLLIRRTIYEDVGGLDEARFKVCYNDIDLCLKVGQAGYKVLWTPHVMLLHHGSASQQAEARQPHKALKSQERFEREREAMVEKWLPNLARDPAYNRHLSLIHRDYRVESDFVVNWDPRIPPQKTRILAWTLDGAPCEYRVKIPLQALNQAQATEFSLVYPPGMGMIRSLLVPEIVRAAPHIFTTSVFLGLEDHLDMLRQLKKHTEIPLVMHLDDFVTAVPKGSGVYEKRHTPGNLKKILAQADRVVTSTQPIYQSAKGLCADIMLLPNYLPRFLWEGLTSRRRQGPKPRVGWAGAMQHGGDLALITEVVKATATEVDWVFFGMCPDELLGSVREFRPFGAFNAYPPKLASLNLDLAIAPLENNKFNEGKSNLRLLEYGFLGWPVVCSDVLPYREAPVKRVSDKPSAWIEAIRERVNDLDAAEREGQTLQRWVTDHWMLEDHLEEWAKAYSFGV